jgi:selenocysteine-specific elongation factor
VRLGGGYVISAAAYEVAQDLVRTECATVGEITLARFRDLGGVGRRDAQLLLERMDVDGVTRRLGDRRVLRRAARGAVRD